MAETPHTIVATERAWAGRVLATFAICTLVAASLTAQAWPLSPMGWVLSLVSVALLAVDLRHLMAGETSVGMIPIAIAALGPAGLAAYLACGTRLSLAGAVVGFGMAGFMAAWFSRMAAATRTDASPNDGDTAIVLGCAVKQGRPSTTLELRLDAALELWRRCPAMRFVVTGGISEPVEPSEAAVMARFLKSEGVPMGQIVLEDRALNTEENLANARTLIGNADGTIWLVTSDYHMLRAAAIARSVGLETAPCPAPTPFSSRLVQWCREVLVILFGA